jgi:hypothetical protein
MTLAALAGRVHSSNVINTSPPPNSNRLDELLAQPAPHATSRKRAVTVEI